MIIEYYRTHPNFGDDINAWMWYDLLKAEFSPEPDVVLFGIGTILSSGAVARHSGAKFATLGSGAGYVSGSAQSIWKEDWIVNLVRGPLTAAHLGLGEDHAATDSAALLSTLEEFAPIASSERSGVVFMPHHTIPDWGSLKSACEQAGVKFLDPFANSRALVHAIRRAKLVIADAMHAAIIADTMRVPWIPVVSSNQINSFKWIDWTMSVGAPYQPQRLNYATKLHANYSAFSHWFGENHWHGTDLDENTSALKSRGRLNALTDNYWVKRLSRKAALAAAGLLPSGEQSGVERLAAQLRDLSGQPGFLSDDRKFADKVQLLEDGLSRLRSAIAS